MSGSSERRDVRPTGAGGERRQPSGEERDGSDREQRGVNTLTAAHPGANVERRRRRLEPVGGVGKGSAHFGAQVVAHSVLPSLSLPRWRASVARALASCDFTVPAEHPRVAATSDSDKSA